MKRILITNLQVVFCILMVILIFAIRILNPELTETQLFLQYWYVWLMIVLSSILVCSA